MYYKEQVLYKVVNSSVVSICNLSGIVRGTLHRENVLLLVDCMCSPALWGLHWPTLISSAFDNLVIP